MFQRDYTGYEEAAYDRLMRLDARRGYFLRPAPDAMETEPYFPGEDDLRPEDFPDLDDDFYVDEEVE